MGALHVVVNKPRIEVLLQLVYGRVNFFAERGAVELVEHCFMQPLADAVGLRMPRFRARMLDILDRQIQLVRVLFGVAAIFRAAIGEDPQQRDVMLVKERNHLVVEQISRSDRRLVSVKLPPPRLSGNRRTDHRGAPDPESCRIDV